MPDIVYSRRALETKSATISSTAVAISAAAWSWLDGTLHQGRRAIVSAIAQPLMMTWDGSTPTATHGHPIAANGTFVVEGSFNVSRIQLIRQGDTDATAVITIEL